MLGRHHHVDAHLVHAAARRGSDLVMLGEVVDEECLDAHRLSVAAGISHWLAATSLVVGILDRDPQVR